MRRYHLRAASTSSKRRRASHEKPAGDAAKVYTEAKFKAAAKDGGADNCFVVLWKGAACNSAGGVYQIVPSWTKAHFGGNLLDKKTCGKVIANWLGRSGSHSGYVKGQ